MTTFTGYLEQIRTLSSCDLKSQIELLVEKEHVQVAKLIAHLAEVSRRNLHLELGYRSLFDYCVKCLGLSEGCAALRIQVSGVCRRHPLILDALADRRISLTAAGKLAPHLTDENRKRLIVDCAGMSKRDVEEYLVRLAPKRIVSAGVRKRPAARVPTGSTNTLAATLAPPDSGCADAAVTARLVMRPKRGSIEPCQADVYNVRFAVDKNFMDKLERAAEVGRVGDAQRNIAQVLERALDEYLEKNDPQKREERREKRIARKVEGSGAEKITGGAVACDEVPRPEERSRTISTPLRDRLLIRAEHRCEYESNDGVRCSERSRLEIDHIKPWARGGASDEKNLRVLCRSHNRLHADQCYGAEFMEQKIEAAQQEKQAGDSRPARPDEVVNPYQVCEPAAAYCARDTWKKRRSVTRFRRRASGHLAASLRRGLAMKPSSVRSS